VKNAGMYKKVSKACRSVPSIFFSRFGKHDSAVLGDKKDHFSRSLIEGAIGRCRWGFPRVLLCGSLRKMQPFPTSFWLVCPYLLKVIGRIESEGGVPGMERTSAVSVSLWREFHLIHALLRLSMLCQSQREYLRSRRRSIYRAICGRGAGGSDYSGNPVAIKCLHLQAASYIALRSHPMSDWLSGMIAGWECTGNLCGSAK
jgi:hypothetical protein